MDKEQLKAAALEVMEYLAAQPERFNAQLALKFKSCGTGDTSRGGTYLDYTYTFREAHANPYGGLHGGIIASIFDTAGGIGAAALSQALVSTTDMSVSYLRAMYGHTFRVHMEYTHIGARMISCTGKMFDSGTGELCATAHSTYMVTSGREKGLRV